MVGTMQAALLTRPGCHLLLFARGAPGFWFAGQVRYSRGVVEYSSGVYYALVDAAKKQVRRQSDLAAVLCTLAKA